MKFHGFTLAILTACSAEPPSHWGGPYGSQAIVASADGDRVYVVDPDESAIATVELATDRVSLLPIAGRPSRIARTNDRLFVSLRARREVLVLDETSLEIVSRIPVGAEPFGIVTHGEQVYVASSLAGEIAEIDAVSLSVKRTWSTPGEPRWLAIHPSGEKLYAASARNGEAYLIDLKDEGDLVQRIALPRRYQTPYAGAFVRRLTGDPTVTPDGRQLLLPAIFADNSTPISDIPGGGEYYGPIALSVEPSVIAIQLGADGEPKPESAQVLAVIASQVSGYPASAVVSPSGDSLLVPMETSAAIMVADPRHESTVAKYRVTSPSEETAPIFEGTEHIGFEPKPMSAVALPFGPTAAAYVSNDLALVYCFLDRVVARVAPAEFMPAEDDLWKPRELEVTDSGIEVMPSSLSRDEDRGRRLFYEGVDPRVTRLGLSCALCHFNGRDDGVTWTFVKGTRQTPSLAGDIEMTAPYRWQGERATVAENAMLTSRGMSSGQGMTELEAEDVERYIELIQSPDSRRRGMADEAIERGREIFFRTDVGCAGCHSGEAYTDNQPHYMLGTENMQTPSLTGVSASAPFFHDGSSPTLGDVLRRSRTGMMGNTSSLDDDEMLDLEAYLESL